MMRIHLLCVLMGSILVMPLIAADKRVVHFDVPAGPAIQTLRMAVIQAEVEIVFIDSIVEGVVTNPVSGQYTVSEALAIMVEGTQLVINTVETEAAFAVSRSPDTGPLSQPVVDIESQNKTITMNNSNNPRNNLFTRLMRGVGTLLVAGITADAVSQDLSEDGDIYELSPFVVSTEEGWTATETLAGSRLKTDLKDIAAQVEVMTLDFMDDFGVTSVEEALIYSINVANPDDRITGNGLGFGVTQISNFSDIRGLGGGTLSRNFFETILPSDNYNITRLTIASGPQAVLFGTGSPAGVLDVTNTRAELSRDFGSLELQFDDFGGERYVIDYNKVIIDDVLAIRGAAMHERRKQEWEPNHDDSDRYYVTALFRPFEKTTISVHYENVELDRNRASRMLPIDEFSPWFVAGQPVFANTWNSTGPGNLTDPVFNRSPDSVTLLVGPNNANGLAPMSFNDMAEIEGPEDFPDVPNQDDDADGWTTSDNQPWFPWDINPRGNLFNQTLEADAIFVSVEQQITEKLFFEFAYSKEEVDQFNSNAGASNTVHVDPNQFLPDGVTPNPNFGKFYTDGIPSFQEQYDELEAWRFSASYEFDFADKFQDNKVLKWFGLHRIGALISEDTKINTNQQGMRYRIIPGPGESDPVFDFTDGFTPIGNRRWGTNADRQVRTRYYYTDPGSDAPYSDFKFDGSPLTLTQSNGQTYTIDPLNYGYTNGDGARLLGGNGASGTYAVNESWMLTYQGYFLDGRIVATYGYRDITAKNRTLQGSTRDNNTGLWPYFRDLEFGDFNEDQTGIVRTQGLAVHPFQGWFDFGGVVSDFTVHFNKSDTFQPNIGRFSPYGDEYPGAEGEGEDYGFRIDLFDNKLSIEYNEFELTGGPSRAANVPFNRWRDPVWNIENRIRNLWPDVPILNEGSGGFRELGRANYWVMSDNTSEGREIVIIARPIRGLNIRFTYTDRDTIESNIGQDWFDWIDERLPVWQSLNVPEGGVSNPRDLNGDGQIGVWTWDTAWYQDNNGGSETVAERYQNETVNGPFGAAIVTALDGKANEFDRAESWNLNTNYTFQDGRLKGFRVGGALRWRSAPLLDYGQTTLNGNPIVDLNNPFYGEEELKVDLALTYNGTTDLLFGERDYRIQLNVRNAMDSDGNVPVTTTIDGRPTRIARVEGRRVILSFEIDL